VGKRRRAVATGQQRAQEPGVRRLAPRVEPDGPQRRELTADALDKRLRRT
jgi:hypothetical protein